MIDYAFANDTARDYYSWLDEKGNVRSCLRRATDGSAGLDLIACEIKRGGTTATIRFGVAVDVRPGRVGLIFVRSGFAADTGLTFTNAVGVIDSDYRGELIAKIRGHVPASYVGVRIAQLVVVDCDMDEPRLLDRLPTTPRGGGGFGSTGN